MAEVIENQLPLWAFPMTPVPPERAKLTNSNYPKNLELIDGFFQKEHFPIIEGELYEIECFYSYEGDGFGRSYDKTDLIKINSIKELETFVKSKWHDGLTLEEIVIGDKEIIRHEILVAKGQTITLCGNDYLYFDCEDGGWEVPPVVNQYDFVIKKV
jgi:hypothetical protein